jgi:hypothetical protein
MLSELRQDIKLYIHYDTILVKIMQMEEEILEETQVES